MSKRVIDFYDRFVDRQIQSGINHRHLAIQRFLEEFKIPRKGKYLEIGCGIGTQTSLLLNYLHKSSEVTAIDISPQNIKIAKKSLFSFSNVELIEGDFLTTDFDKRFDVIILPDVIEHIPLDYHNDLFKKTNGLLSKNGLIVIHIPHPDYQEYLIKNFPEKMQIVDQVIELASLSRRLSANDLTIDQVINHSVYQKPYDYQVILVKRREFDFIPVSKPKNDILLRRITRKIKKIIH